MLSRCIICARHSVQKCWNPHLRRQVQPPCAEHSHLIRTCSHVVTSAGVSWQHRALAFLRLHTARARDAVARACFPAAICRGWHTAGERAHAALHFILTSVRWCTLASVQGARGHCAVVARGALTRVGRNLPCHLRSCTQDTLTKDICKESSENTTFDLQHQCVTSAVCNTSWCST
jgi:hypothetical protein